MTTSGKPCRDEGMACGCCAGTEPITPESTANRPGLAALAYRVGTHAAFLETMKARLSTTCLGTAQDCAEGRGTRPLESLKTRDGSDPAIALLDAWATVGDVLTFYQERLANEGYLRTATERRSVLELARLIGYRLRPGVAASVYLAYTIDANTKEEVLIPAGARVQSVPGPDELPQSFETSEDLRARAAWNLLGVRKTQPQQWRPDGTSGDLAGAITLDGGTLYLKGISTNLKANDPLLLVERNPGDVVGEPSGKQHLFRVTEVKPQPDPNGDPEADRTKVEIVPWAGIDAAQTKFEAVRAAAESLIASAPEGKTAADVVEHLRALSDVAGRTTESHELAQFIEQKTLPLLEASLTSVKGPAPKLKSWLGAARRLIQVAHGTPGAIASGTSATEDFSPRLNKLIKRPSQPLPNALQLPRTLEASFGPTGDAGLKILGTASPELRDTLGAAVSTYAKASPGSPFEVFAFRLKAGLFGRNAPKKQKMVKTIVEDDSDPKGLREETETEVVGEWPIVGIRDHRLVLVTESSDTIFLDGQYDGILPESWVILDSSAVPVFSEGTTFLEPAVFHEDDKGQQSGAFLKYLVARAKNVATKVARSEYGISGDSARIGLDRDWLRLVVEGGAGSPEKLKSIRDVQAVFDHDFQVIRGTAVYAQSELLELAEAPIEKPVCVAAAETDPSGSEGPYLELDGLYQDIEPGRFVIVTGERSDIPDTTGVLASEPAMVTAVIHDVRRSDAAFPLDSPDLDSALPGDRVHTFIGLDKPLSYCYRRDTVKLYGNVVKADHGETRNETLGGGDGAKALQSFTLKQSPLTYLAAPTAVGAESTLQLFVNDVRWHEGPSFVDVPATERAYVTRADNTGKTTITTGNGEEGARLPTGTANVKAVYRTGIGKAGNVRAGQLTLLSTRPLGVKEVTNPLRASGGADSDTRDQARRNAPLAVMSLDRLVSTPDYADFARCFAGIAKAAAVEISDGRRTVVHVTIAGTDDVPIDPASDLFRNLRRAMRDLGDPFQPLALATRDLLLLVISAKLRIHPDHRWERVVTDVRTHLLETFGFDRRELAQDVTASELISAMQSVRGVVYVDLDSFGPVPSTKTGSDAEAGPRPLTPEETSKAVEEIVGHEPERRVLALPARPEDHRIAPAQLAILVPEVPDTLVLNQIKD